MMELAPAFVALVIAILVTPATMRLANVTGMLDRPNSRKVHSTPTPRLGGIAIFAGTIAGAVGMMVYRHFWGSPISSEVLAKFAAILSAGVVIFGVGLVDDIRTVSSRFKFLTLLGAAAMVCGSGVVIGELRSGSGVWVSFAWTGWAVTALWIIGVAVAINFIDGLDGLAGGLTILATSVLSYFLLVGGHGDYAIIPLAMTGALAGFMVFNWHPAKTFMGDCGSMTIGFLLASLMVLANPVVGTMKGFVLPAIAISIPLVDAVLTFFRRHYQQRRSVFSAERGHIHHRLLDSGLSHLDAVRVLYLVSILAVGIGMVSLTFEGLGTFGGLALLVPLIWGTFRFAGSVRTSEMVVALRNKREIDRVKKHYRTTFEDLQLEFHHVRTFSEWWESVCSAAERLDFVHMNVMIPAERDGDRVRHLIWETESTELQLCDKMRASIPIANGHASFGSASATVEIAINRSLESASERLGLFSRLMTEHSLTTVRVKERTRKAKGVGASGLPSETADHLSTNPHAMLGSTPVGALPHLRVAVVHDFLYTYCGAERVLEQIIDAFPHCDLFSLFDFIPESQRGFLRGKPVTTSFIQRLPFAHSKHRAYLPLMPLAVEQLDVSEYDLIISSSYLAAKGVITGPDQLHVCYCHSPARYAWDLQHQYLSQAGLGMGPRGIFARAILHYLRSWDVRTSLGVDHFIANSQFVARRIRKVYRRNALVVHPPVNTSQFELGKVKREEFYLVAGRMVSYKRTDLIVDAFKQMPDRKLVVIGDGPEFEKISQSASPNVTFLGFQDSKTLVDHMQRAKALVFAAEEDFGIVPVEALSCGTPVIAFGRGGVTESVVDGVHGVMFEEQTREALIDAVERFESQRSFGHFDPVVLRNRSQDFSEERFTQRFVSQVESWAKAKWQPKTIRSNSAVGGLKITTDGLIPSEPIGFEQPIAVPSAASTIDPQGSTVKTMAQKDG